MDETALSRLTNHQRNALMAAADAAEQKTAAARLGISHRTLQHHLKAASLKLGYDTPGAAVLAYQRFQAIGPFDPKAGIASDPRGLAQLPNWLFLLLDLVVPEITRGGDNSLPIARRMIVIVTRTVLLTVLLLGSLGIVKEIGGYFSRLS